LGRSHGIADRRSGRELAGWREVAIGVSAYAAYLLVRRAVWNDAGRARARHNGRRLMSFERTLGVLVEPRVQSAALRFPRVLDALNAGYAGANVALSVGWLVRMFHAGDDAFLRERRVAVAAFVGALPCFLLFPTAPPRKLDEFVDTLANRGIDLDHPALVRLYNPIAAMPATTSPLRW